MNKKIHVDFINDINAEKIKKERLDVFARQADEDISKFEKIKSKHDSKIIVFATSVVFIALIAMLCIAINQAWGLSWILISYPFIVGAVGYFILKDDPIYKIDKSWFEFIKDNKTEFKKDYINQILDKNHEVRFLTRLIHNDIIQITLHIKNEDSENYLLSYVAETWDHRVYFDTLGTDFEIEISDKYDKPSLSLKDKKIFVSKEIGKSFSDVFVCEPHYVCNNTEEEETAIDRCGITTKEKTKKQKK